MSSTYIIGIIVALLIALSCYAFVSQSIDKKRKQKQRLLAALKTRSRNFKYMLNGFPPDFLTKDLQTLVNRCLVDVTEQLARIEPDNKTYVEELQLFSKQLEEIKRKPQKTKRKQLDNPQQVKEVKKYLQELNKFIASMVSRGNISKAQSTSYERQIKNLVLQMTVDAYLLNAKQSQQSNKARLAVHYYTLALKLLTKENAQGTYQKQITQLKTVIAQLEDKLAEEEPEYKESEHSVASRDAAAKEWDELNEDDDSWKKKRVYD
jgi:chromosome segregation ATPase